MFIINILFILFFLYYTYISWWINKTCFFNLLLYLIVVVFKILKTFILLKIIRSCSKKTFTLIISNCILKIIFIVLIIFCIWNTYFLFSFNLRRRKLYRIILLNLKTIIVKINFWFLIFLKRWVVILLLKVLLIIKIQIIIVYIIICLYCIYCLYCVFVIYNYAL